MTTNVEATKKMSPFARWLESMKKQNEKPKYKRSVKHSKTLSEAEEAKVVKLYNALIPGEDNSVIDIDMIVNEAFPKFEETIGEAQFAKLKRHFGIGLKSNQKPLKDSDVSSLIAKLRTVENAQYYITGYKEIISEVAGKLIGAPETMSDLVKVKLLRMFFTIINDNEFFIEDYRWVIGRDGQRAAQFDMKMALENNKHLLGPEELVSLYNMKLKILSGIFYEAIVLEVDRIGKLSGQLRAEMLEFAELKLSKENGFESVNKACHSVTYGNIRNLKSKINAERSRYPLELFYNKQFACEGFDVTDLYMVYKVVTTCPWEQADVHMVEGTGFSASIFVPKKFKFYEIIENFLISGQAEVDRFKFIFEYAVKHDLMMKSKLDGTGKELEDVRYYDMGAFKGVIDFARVEGFIHDRTTIPRDIRVIDALLSVTDATETFKKYKNGEITHEDVKKRLGLTLAFMKQTLKLALPTKDDVFEYEVPREGEEASAEVKPEVQKTAGQVVEEPKEPARQEAPKAEEKPAEEKKEKPAKMNPLVKALAEYAVQEGYTNSTENVDLALVENVLIDGNESIIKKFKSGKISGDDLEEKLKFASDFDPAMYFDPTKIDITQIEAKLQDIKKYGRKGEIQKYKLVVKLYCYVVTEGIGCGPKRKPAKRNKGLKPEILLDLIAA